MATAGNWKESKLYQNITMRKQERKHGARVWLTRQQLTIKYQSEAIAEEIVQTKLGDPELFKTQTKMYPDAPTSEARLDLGQWDILCGTLLTPLKQTRLLRIRHEIDLENFMRVKPLYLSTYVHQTAQTQSRCEDWHHHYSFEISNFAQCSQMSVLTNMLYNIIILYMWMI